MCVSCLIYVGFYLRIIDLAIRDGPRWGFGALLIPPVALLYVITHWEKTRHPFLMALMSLGVAFLGSVLASGTHQGG